jgi:OHCU decarboxylase
LQSPALTAASAAEQRRAGLEGATPAEAARLAELNIAYQQRFGFPFILAVRGHDPASIIACCESRLRRERGDEFATALVEIGRIAGIRLADRIG